MLRTVSSALVALLVVFGTGASSIADATASTSSRADDVLATLAVKGRGPKTGYAREQFGPAWADVDRNGCDTRDDVLNRDLVAKEWRPGTHGCVVVAGVVRDPYTGRRLVFAKADAAAVQIDHVVALSDAWQKGAAQWDAARRRAFANDPLNLLAVDGPTNAQKSDGDAATWLPPPAVVPLPVRGAAGGGEGQVAVVGHAGRARRDRARAGAVPGAARPDVSGQRAGQVPEVAGRSRSLRSRLIAAWCALSIGASSFR